MNRRWLTVAMIASILGVVCAAVSLSNFISIYEGGMVEESFCEISEKINCNVIDASTYSSIKGFPVAGAGLIYYVLIFIFSTVARFLRGFKKPTVAFCWWSTIPAVLYSMILAYIAVEIIGAVCLTCIGMYIANLLLFISLFFAMRIPFKEAFSFLWGYWATVFTGKKKGIDFMPKFGTHFLAAAIIFVIGFIFVSNAAGKIKHISDFEKKEYLSRFYRQSKYDIQFDKKGTALWGAKDAPVTIVEFSDYRCPFCRLSALTIKPFLTEYKENVAYYFINYPLDSECNHYMTHQMHPGACLGAKAGICAEKMGQFWKYHDELFKSTGQIDMKLVAGLAKKLGLDEEGFKSCLESTEVERQLKEEIEAARRIYITGTPSIFINDRRLKFWRNPEILRAIVKKEIADSKK